MTWAFTVYGVWAFVAVAAIISALVAARGWRVRGRLVRRPSAAVAALLAHGRWVRLLLVLGWIWLGVHFFAR